jgi:hypothetical protein
MRAVDQPHERRRHPHGFEAREFRVNWIRHTLLDDNHFEVENISARICFRMVPSWPCHIVAVVMWSDDVPEHSRTR